MLTIKDLFQKIKFRNSWTQFYYFIFAVTLFKIILMALFSSDYENKLFIPFVENYILNNDINPYDDFLDDNGIVAFPYPPLMLFIEYLSVYFINTLGIAGMGSSTIKHILNDSSKLVNINKIVTQSNNDHEMLRSFMNQIGYYLDNSSGKNIYMNCYRHYF